MLSDEEKRKLIEQYSFGRDINAFALVAEVERAVLAKASQQVQGERDAFNEFNNDTDCPLAGLDAKAAAWRAWEARALLAMPAPKQEPFAYCFTDVNGKAKELCDAPETMLPQDKRKVTALYKHPAPPQAAAIPEFDSDLVIAVLEDYADMQTSGFIPTANRHPVSNVMEQVEALSASPKPEDE